MKNKIIATILVLLLVLAGAGVALVQKGYFSRWTGGEQGYWEWYVQTFPQKAKGFTQLAEYALSRPEFEQTLEEFEKIQDLEAQGMSLDSERVGAIKEEVNRVLGLYQEALQLEPDSFEAREGLAQFYLKFGDLDSAKREFEVALQMRPDKEEIYEELIDVYARMNEVPGAIQVAHKMLRQFSDQPETYVLLAQKMNDFLKDVPNQVQYRHFLRQILEDFTKFVNQKKGDSRLFYQLGNLYRLAGERERAISAYQLSLDMDARNVAAMNGLGELYLESGQVSKAVSLFKEALKVNPDSVQALVRLGDIYGQLQEWEQSKEYYVKATNLDGTDNAAWFHLAYIQEKRGQLREAVASYKEALKNDSRNADIYYNLGNVQVKLKQMKDAMVSFQGALAVDPNHRNAAVNLCLLAFQTGDLVGAMIACEEAELLGYDLPVEIREKLNH